MRREPAKSTQPADLRPRAFSYLRFSTPEQARGDSFRRQLEAARAYANQHNLHLDESLRDEGVSAFKGKNRDEKAALGAFLKRVEEGVVPPGSYLLVESLDRLSREQVLDALELFLGLTRNGITIVTLADQRVYSRASMRDDQTQLLISIVVMSRAYEESALKSKRVSAAWNEKRQRAQADQQAMTARAPAWIRLLGGPKTGRYELIPERAQVVRQILVDTIAGVGRRTIQKRLNSEGVQPWGEGNAKGKFWHDSYIQKIIQNPAVYGTFVPRGKLAGGSTATADEPIAKYFPPVVDEETFWRAQAASKLRGSGRGTPGQRKNLLSGLAKCGSCGHNMIYVVRDKARLRCGKAHASAGCGHRDLYDYQRLELSVLFGLNRPANSMISPRSEPGIELAQELAAAETKRTEAEGRLNNLLALVEEGGSGPTVAKAVARLETELASLTHRVALLAGQINEKKAALFDVEEAALNVTNLYGSLRQLEGEKLIWARASIQQKLKLLIETIAIDRTGVTVAYKDGTLSQTRSLGAAAAA